MEVKVYSTRACPWCRKVKAFLREHGVLYGDVDVDSDKEGAKEMFRKSGQRSVPVVDVDGTIVVGFDEGKLKEVLGI